MSTDESTNVQPEQGPEVIDLAELAGEPTASFKWKGVEYFVQHPLSLTLFQAAVTEKTSRDINTIGAKTREGTASEADLRRYEDALTKYAAAVTIDLPDTVLDEMQWWQKLAVIGLFQKQQRTRQTKEGGEASVENPTVETPVLQTTVT